MKTLKFEVTVEVDRLSMVDIEYLEQHTSDVLLSSNTLEIGPSDEIGVSAKLLTVTENE